MKEQKQITFSAYKSGDGFISKYQKLIRDVVVPYQYEILNDRIPGAEKSHAIENFINAAKVLQGQDSGDGFYGWVFQDSDVAKWIEAASSVLAYTPDDVLQKNVNDVIDLIASAQDEDGYLDTAFTVKDKDRRWKNLLEGHELYCSGHMMEAAVANYESTGKTKLLEVMEKNVECIYNHFITEKNHGCPGHPEVELALLKMYRVTKNKKCLELAEYFIDERGKDPEFFAKEAAGRNWTVWGSDGKDASYNQSGLPVREQKDATGHSVRAVYLYTAMADLASEINDKELLKACNRLWDSITKKRMYVTGGIGSTGNGEAFTVDYNLPNDTAYCETCASVGLMMFASRMLELDADRKYSDVMERAFYNTVLAGMQLDGKKFFYVNPLEVIVGVSGVASTHKHVVPQRPSWYSCACCPPNVARTIAEFGKYAYGENETTSFCHLYAEGEIQFENGMNILCKTEYPFDGEVSFGILNGGKNFAVRIPEWSKNTELLLNGAKANVKIKNGYAYFNSTKSGDVIIIRLDMSVQKIYASSAIASDTGKVCLQRGPLVYCFEGVDNKDDVLSIRLHSNGDVKTKSVEKSVLGRTEMILADGERIERSDELYSNQKPNAKTCTLTAIPYFQWCNRGLNQMRVWIDER